MFTIKYKPNKIEEFVGNKQLIQPFTEWLLQWNENNKQQKCALFSGICGVGKDLFIELFLKKYMYNIVYLDLDNDRDNDFMKTVIKPFIKTKKTFDGRENILVVNNVDCGGNYGFMSNLTECIKQSIIPIICICDNRYDQSIKPIIQYCQDFKMIKPTYEEVYRLLYHIVKHEKIQIHTSDIQKLYEQSNGDIRFMLNSLQFHCKSSNKNIQSTNIFDTTSQLLYMDETLETKYDLYWLANELHPLMIQENYINNMLISRDEIKKLENVSYSASVLSDMDIFDSYVNMIHWEFEPYVALSMIDATSKCNKKSMITFPQILGRISTMTKNKREKLDYENVSFFEKEKKVKVKEEKEKVKEKKLKEVKEKKVKVKQEKEKKVKGKKNII